MKKIFNHLKSKLNIHLHLKIVIYFSFFLISCNNNHSVEDKKDKKFCMTDSMQKIIQIDTVKESFLENELNLSGKIQPVPSKNIKLYPLISGIVTNMYVELGDYVKEGQALVEIISSEVAEFEKELANAEADLQIAKKNLSVAKDMYESKLISEKEFIMTQKEVEKAEAELKRLRSIFSIYHINESGTYTIKSPISGYITTKNISIGTQIRNDNPEEIMTISNIDKLWAVANVYESDMYKIKQNENAYIQTIAYPDSIFKGKINKIFEVLDPITRTMKVAIELDNKNYLLKPEMFARVKIFYTIPNKMTYVSNNAVIFDNEKYYVLVFKNKCDIEVRRVEIERKTGNKIFIKSGLKKDEYVITKNGLLIFDAITEN